MRHRKKISHLGRTASHQRAMLRNLVTSLFVHGRVKTTLPKAQAARSLAERLVTLAKQQDLHARRLALRFVQDRETVKRLFETIAPHYQDRPGGYSRVLKLGRRLGDNAPTAILELVGWEAMGPTGGGGRPEKSPTEKRGKD